MKRSIIALALAGFAAVSFAGDQYGNDAGESKQDNVVNLQLADGFEWQRSRPGAGGQESDRASS
jgi:hypothetical protein